MEIEPSLHIHVWSFWSSTVIFLGLEIGAIGQIRTSIYPLYLGHESRIILIIIKFYQVLTSFNKF